MDRTITFSTDAATLAIFDPAVVAHRIEDVEDWWAMPFHELPEVALGQIGLVNLGGDGFYTVRISDGDLTDLERAYAVEFVVLGLEVDSGQVMVGPGEYLPGGDAVAEGPDFEPFLVELSADHDYLLWIFRLRWWDSPQFADDAVAKPPEVVILVRQREEPFSPPQEEPRLHAMSKQWLYPDEPRTVGPQPGMVLTTTVVVRGKEKLLKPAGPLGYRPILADMSGLAWRDQVETRVVAVDPASESFTAELVRKLPRAD